MAAGSNSQQNFRKAIGALKDSTMVGIAKVNSEYKELDVAILKATNHVEVLPKEKHVRTILGAVSGSRPRAYVAYCIDALARRLTKTHTWAVALKILIVIHRAMREVDYSFCEELIYYNNSRGHLLNLLHFKDDSSPNAWDNSTWIRTYALYLEECLECFRVLKYDFHRDHSRTKKFDTPALLEQLPALQQLLFRLLACQPVGAARYNFMIQYALSIVAAESVRLYVAITDGILNLVDKYFEMQRHDAVRALEIYRRAGDQAQRLSEFFEMCRSLDFGRRQKYVKIEQPPISFLSAMEDYVKDAPQSLMLPWRANDEGESIPRKVITEPAANLDADTEETSHPSVDSQQDLKTDKCDVDAAPLIPDLLSWDEPCQEVSELADKTSLSLSTTPLDESSNPGISLELSSQESSWELALVTAASSGTTSAPQSKGCGLDRSTLDSLYEVALAKTNQNGAYQMGMVSSNPFESGSYYQEMVLYDPIQAAQPNFMQVAQNPQLQAAFTEQKHHHQEQYIVGHYHMQNAEIPQQQAVFFENQCQHQEQRMAVPDSMKISEIPKEQGVPMELHQQQEQPMVGHDSANPFGNPFVQQCSMPCPPHSQPSNSSLI